MTGSLNNFEYYALTSGNASNLISKQYGLRSWNQGIF